MTKLSIVALTLLSFVAGGCQPTGPLFTGNVTADTASAEQRIKIACLAAPIFKSVDGAVTLVVPEATLPVDLVNAGVTVVCADPAAFAAADAKTGDWVKKNLDPVMDKLKKLISSRPPG